MSSIIFHNPGEIDIKGAHIAGLSAKDDTATAIGYFGTGLKYVIACVLRNGGSITIYSGLTCHEFFASKLDFRGKEFQQIGCKTTYAGTMGDTAEPVTELLGFTTDYGKDWKPWQIFRELYANARDEGGDVYQGGNGAPRIGPDMTNIVVWGWKELESEYLNRDEIILPKGKFWNGETSEVQCSYGPSTWLYYKGVRVDNRACTFMWNFLRNLILTEDRTLAPRMLSTTYRPVRDFILHQMDEQHIRQILGRMGGGDRFFERNALEWYTAPKTTGECSEAFAKVATALYRANPGAYEDYAQLAHAYCPELVEARKVKLTPLQEKMLERAKALVSKAGFEAEIRQIPIIVEQLGGRILGKYEAGTISLSPMTFDQGTKQVVSTLYEECLHARTGYADLTYEMQTHLFNTIIGLFEELWGEPC